jgi:hypothetical protein
MHSENALPYPRYRGLQGVDQRVSPQNFAIRVRCTPSLLLSAVTMAVQSLSTLSIKFSGYWSEYNRGLMPRRSGVFCVYRAYFDDQSKTTTMRELLHIGAAVNVNEHLADPAQAEAWRACLGPTDSLSFSFGAVALQDLVACEMALVMAHRPRCNTAVPAVFPFDRVALKLTHRTPLLHTRFTVGSPMAGVVGRLCVPLLRRGLDFLRGLQPG